MGWQDRPYNREENAGPLGMRPTYSVSMWIGGICFAIFLIDAVLSGSARGNALSPTAWGNFNLTMAVHHWQLWRFITFQFLHANFLHLFGNLIALIFFGPLIESTLGARRFLFFYLLCGISGAVGFSILSFVPGLMGPFAQGLHLVGASGGIFGILIASALVAPELRVSIMFLPISMTLRTMAWIYLGFSVFSVVFGSSNVGGEAAHLGGAVMGALLIKNQHLLAWADWFGGGAVVDKEDSRYWSPDSKIKKRSRNPIARLRRWLDDRKQLAIENETKEVDRILDKVHDHGLASLTSQEKRVLQRATDRKRGNE